MIDPREKERLFEEAIAKNNYWLGVIARNNAPIDNWEDLEQEIRIAFWKSLDSYGERSSLETFFFSVAKKFRRRNHNTRKRIGRISCILLWKSRFSPSDNLSLCNPPTSIRML